MSLHANAFDPIVQAHRVVRESIALVTRSTDPDAIDRALTSLHAILPDHFHAEERVGGFFDHLRHYLPNEGRVRILIGEHRDLERDLIVLLGPGTRDILWVERTQAFARRLQDHERLEARLGAAGLSNF